MSAVVANGYPGCSSENHAHAQQQQDVRISLSALSRGRIPDSFEIENSLLNDNAPQNLAAVPNIECTHSVAVVNQAGSSSWGYGGVEQVTGAEDHSACVVAGISPNLNSVLNNRQQMGEGGGGGGGDGGAAGDVTPAGDPRRNRAGKGIPRKPPPPLPPRKHKTKKVAGGGDVVNNRNVRAELAPPGGGFPSKENTSSFDSMEAFSGSSENMTEGSAGGSDDNAAGTGSALPQQQQRQQQQQHSSLPPSSHNSVVATLSVHLEGTTESQSQSEAEDMQTDSSVLTERDGSRMMESFDESGATSESYESAPESGAGPSEKIVLRNSESPAKRQNNACTAAGSFVTSIAAQLARIPSIDSAVSERITCCPVTHQSSVESASGDDQRPQQLTASMEGSLHAGAETGIPSGIPSSSGGAKAHIVVTAQPTAQETSRPVGVTHAHAVPLTAVIPLTTELQRQGSASSDVSSPQVISKHTSVHMHQITGSKYRQGSGATPAAFKPVPAPRNINRQNSDETADVVFTFAAGSSGEASPSVRQEEEDGSEPFSPRRRLLSDQERQQNRQQIQEQLARWHHERQQGGNAAPEAATPLPVPGTSHENTTPPGTSRSHGSPSHTALQRTPPASTAPSVMSSSVNIMLNANSPTVPVRGGQAPRQPPPPPPRDGSTLSTPAPGSSTAAAAAPPHRDDHSALTNADNPSPPRTTVSSTTVMPFAMTTVLTTGHTNSAPVSRASDASTDNTGSSTGSGGQLSVHVNNNNRDFTATREAIQQRLLQWHQQQQQLHRQGAQGAAHAAHQTVPPPTAQHPVLPQIYALQHGRSGHQVRNALNLPRTFWLQVTL